MAALCRNGHSHREMFDDRNMLLAIYAPDDPEAASVMRQCLQNILIVSAPFYLGVSDSANNDAVLLMNTADARCFRQMCLHIWYLRSEDNGWQGDALLFFALQTLTNSPSSEDYYGLFDNVVIKVIGPYNFLAGLRVYMEQKNFPDPVYHENVIRALIPVLSTDPYRAHYSSSGFLAAVRTMVDSYTSFQDREYWKILEAVLELLLYVSCVGICACLGMLNIMQDNNRSRFR